MAADFPWSPSPKSKPTRNPRVAAVQYDDGYEEAAIYGINSIPSSWDLVFELTDGDIIKAMDDFLYSTKGMPFTWVQPWPFAQDLLHWTCREWTPVYDDNGGRMMGLTATFKQAFVVGG